MAYSIPENRYHVRSVSFPSRSHPSTLRIEEELNKVKTWQTTTTSATNLNGEAICFGLSSIRDLYKCAEDVLQMPITQQNEKLVDEVLDGSVKLLDVCDTIRNILSQMKDNASNLRSGLRRRSGESSIESSADAYICCRKKLRKEIVKCFASLKRMETKFVSCSLLNDEHLSMVVRVLREISSITISIFRSLLSFISGSASKPKTSKWSLVSNLLHKRQQVGCQGKAEETSEVESVDFAIHALYANISNKDAEIEKVQTAQKRLNALETSIEGLEDGLECLFKCLIQTRVSLLNNLSH